MSENWHNMSAADLGRGIGAGSICPVELTESFLDAARDHPFGAQIYARMMRQQALDVAAAARARAKAGRRRGVLDGVPVSWKDLFDTAGVAPEAGPAMLKGRVPDVNAVVVERLTLAGMPPLGKTHQTELAFSGLGVNPVTATPPGAYDPGAAPGGSSSGAAASVRHGLAPVAIGSDTGGSVRVPSAWNDLVGLKTTAGRIPLGGTVELAARFDTIGPLARNVEDAALSFALLDESTAPDLRGASLRGVRLLVLENVALDGLDPEIAAEFEAAGDRLAAAGARVSRGRVAQVDEAMALAGILYTAECYGAWAELIEAHGDRMFPPIRARFLAGRGHEAHAYIAGWRQLEALRAGYAQACAGFDAVLVPSTANLPPQTEALLADQSYFAAENLRALRNARIGNLMGLCALSLPTRARCVGITLMAAPMQERRLLRLGAAAENVVR